MKLQQQRKSWKQLDEKIHIIFKRALRLMADFLKIKAIED